MQQDVFSKTVISNDPIIRNATEIFNTKFLAKVAYKDTHSDLELKTFGLISVGDKLIDKQMHNEFIDVALTINEMVEYFRKGINFKITKHSDTKIIYDIISQYLIAWNHRIYSAINISNPPLQDLEDLDKLASAVYIHAKIHFRITDMHDKLAKGFGASGAKWIGRNSFDNPSVIKEADPNDKHRSLIDNIIDKRNNDRISKGDSVTIKGTGSNSLDNLWKPKWKA